MISFFLFLGGLVEEPWGGGGGNMAYVQVFKKKIVHLYIHMARKKFYFLFYFFGADEYQQDTTIRPSAPSRIP